MTTVPWQELPGPHGEPVASVAADAKGVLYAVTATGVHASADEAGSWRLFAEPGADVLVSATGEAWATRGAAVERAGDVRPASDPLLPPEPRDPGEEEITALAMDPAGALWAAFRSDRLTFYPGFDDGVNPPIRESAHLVTRAIRRSVDGGASWTTVSDDLDAAAFAFDARGATWAAGDSGVHVVDERGWRRVFERPATCLAVDLDLDRIVVGTSMGAWLSRDAGRTFQPIERRYGERGEWGSMEGEAHEIALLARAPDGAIWTGVPGHGVFRLAASGHKWDSLNFGLTLVPRVGMRQGHVRPTSLAFTPAAAYVATEAHGLFRRPPE